MVREVPISIKSMFCHELNNLQSALLAINVRNVNIRFEQTGWTRGVLEKAVRQDWGLDWVLDHSRNGPGPSLRLSCSHLGILWQFGARVRCEGYPIMSRVKDRLLNLQMQLRPTADLRNEVAGHTWIRRGSSARRHFLRI